MSLDGFHPVVREWFSGRFERPSEPQARGWPAIRAGQHTLIAAPTGTGKTLTGFLWAIDGLLRRGEHLDPGTRVLYVSPLKALGNDVQQNLQGPLAGMREIDPGLPEISVLVRSGDTPPSVRAAMRKTPPHILVTTPESLYILLTSDGGRGMLRTVETVIVDEIHAVAGDKRGAHLALSLERLEALTPRPPQRIGLSATQKPIEETASLLVGRQRQCTIVDLGHGRALDLRLEVPESPLDTVCSHETWEEIYMKMAALIREHRTTLVFVNTRKMAERIAARLSDLLGKEQVASHHGSLARERRLEAEQRLKAGSLRALVATASLELGIDVGDVELVIQVGVTSSIAMMLQRVGRAGHALALTPKGRLFPLTRDELVCGAALLDAIRRGELDRTGQPVKPLDILAQQIVAACVPESWDEDDLYGRLGRAWPYRDLSRADFDAVVSLHTGGRRALLHRDGVNGKIRATKRARLTAITSGGAIPDTADYRVLLEPEGTFIGSLNEDFAIESTVGDIFQLGNASWQILKVESGVVRVADAKGAPPTLPFWLGEAPARTLELSASLSRLREMGQDTAWLEGDLGLPSAAATQISGYLREGARALGTVPTQKRIVLERFFDESGGMQLVLHSLFGGRINRAWGLALRKRFCRHFGFELQAAANEEAIVISLGPHHSFELDEVFDYLSPKTVRDVLVQALLASPIFTTRWRWNVSRSLLLARTQNGGKRVPAALLRMRADDLLVQAFPAVMACGETLPPGDLPIPWEHPIVRQTLDDCLGEAMDVDGLITILEQLGEGRLERVAVDTPEPSVLAAGILNAMPYAFLDDAPLEERRTQAVLSRRGLSAATADTLGALDPEAVSRVRQDAWPQPEDAEEVHEALLWMGFVSQNEARKSGWDDWLQELQQGRRVELDDGRWFAVEAPRDPVAILRGRLEALGPVFDDPGKSPCLTGEERQAILTLESEGVALRCRIDASPAWCDRRLLARIHRDTLDRLRREIEPVSGAVLWRFLATWQHAEGSHHLEGPQGVKEVIRQLAGFEVPSLSWEVSVLPARVRGYRPEWLDQLALTGEVVWSRLWGAGNAPVRSTPISMMPRAEMDEWLGLARLSGTRPGSGTVPLSSHAAAVIRSLETRGALFLQELEIETGLLSAHLDMGLSELIGQALVTCDSFGGLRRLLAPDWKRRARKRVAPAPAGRWSLIRQALTSPEPEQAATFVARRLLDRYGVVFRRLILREKTPVPWRDLVRVYRRMELRGDVRGGRFVSRFAGEQYALPSAVESLRRVRREQNDNDLSFSAADPLNLQGILTPDPRVSSTTRRRVTVSRETTPTLS